MHSVPFKAFVQLQTLCLPDHTQAPTLIAQCYLNDLKFS
jgi:hypothetical protein